MGDDQFLDSELDADSAAASTFEDAQSRHGLVRALVAARSIHKPRLKQTDVARALGASQAAISALENGRSDPRLSVLQRYARACGLELRITIEPAAQETTVAELIVPISSTPMRRDAGVVRAARLAASASIQQVLRDFINERGRPGVARGNVADESGEREPTRDRTLKGLTSLGWITSKQNEPSGHLELNEDAASFFGLSIRAGEVRGVVTGLRPTSGPVHVDAEAVHDLHPTAVMQACTRLVSRLRAEHGVEPMGIGVELSGPVNATDGAVIYAPDLAIEADSLWSHFPLEDELQKRFDARTVVANDAKALATLELLRDGAPDGLLVVNMSESEKGIGAGLVFNGALIRGADGQSGEIGHVIVDPDGIPCERCGGGRRGCLETVASAHAVAASLGATSITDVSGLNVGPTRLQSAFSHAGSVLGRVLADAVTLLNPRELVIYGQRDLVDVTESQSARIFLSSVNDELQARGFSKTNGPRCVVTQRWTGPLAAAAVTVNDFISRPLEYSPEMGTRRPRSDASAMH
ncbi:ROK family protein [Cellulomonas aerilata]|uniref:ROK family protein n=1 Tax=Cellulomonas aerilata TaxID=515326 RepID=UPI001FE6F809|nr:ROK family protein [Cellulomonas aerilata]